jgi:hypothetical protein
MFISRSFSVSRIAAWLTTWHNLGLRGFWAAVRIAKGVPTMEEGAMAILTDEEVVLARWGA